ncbi:DNL zinc finger-domain-containing protein [Phlebopus sp. FC_14]|nr:DNL zinc finger-domain-containing protein [Phlebopus sp. FC_14]
MIRSRLLNSVSLTPAVHIKVASRALRSFPTAPRTTPQLRFARADSSLANPKPPPRNKTDSTESSLPSTLDHAKLDSAEPRLAMAFTCTADGCNHRSAHMFTKRSYERGIVIIQCPSCKNRHLIADHLGWFKEDTEQGKLKTIEDILRARGEEVRRGTLDSNGDIEIVDP